MIRNAPLLLLLGLVLCLPAHAMRCGNRIVSEGDIVGHVLAICGEPAASRSWTEIRERPLLLADHRHHLYRRARLVTAPVEVLVEEWTYNLGARRFMRVLRFENGQLVRIRTTRYGYPE